jgi:rubredoxin
MRRTLQIAMNYALGVHAPVPMETGNFKAEHDEHGDLVCPFCGQTDWKKKLSLVIYCPTCFRSYEDFGKFGLRQIK